MINPSRWPIVAASPASDDRYVKSERSGRRAMSMPSIAELGQRPPLGGEERDEQGVVGMRPGIDDERSWRRPLGAGVQLHRHWSRIAHDPTAAASPIVSAPAAPTSNASSVPQRTHRNESKNTSLPHVGHINRCI